MGSEYDNINGSDAVTDNITEKVQNLSTAQTDMLFQYLANNDKIKDINDVKYYNKSDYDKKSSEKEKVLSDDINDYIIKDESEKFKIDTDIEYKSNRDDYKSYSSDNEYKKSNEKKEFESEHDKVLAKLDLLRQLGELRALGITISKNYSLSDNIDTMRYELNLHRSIRQKQNGIKWLENLMLNGIYGIELLNETFDPFGFKLDGWADQMSSDSNEYYDVLGQLYEKYCSSSGSFPPELKIAFLIGQSAVKHHSAQKALSQVPSMKDEMMANKELKEKLRQQSANNNNMQHKEAVEKLEKIHELQYFRDQANINDNVSNYSKISRKSIVENQIRAKEQELESLYNQLRLERSDAKSMYTTSTIKSKMSNTPYNPTRQYSNFDNQKTLKMPLIPQSIRDYRPPIYVNDNINQNNNRSVDALNNMDKILENAINKGKKDELGVKSNASESVYTIDSKGATKKRTKKKTPLKFDT